MKLECFHCDNVFVDLVCDMKPYALVFVRSVFVGESGSRLSGDVWIGNVCIITNVPLPRLVSHLLTKILDISVYDDHH